MLKIFNQQILYQMFNNPKTITKQKPIISYYKSGDPCLNLRWVTMLTDINIITTKRLSNEFIDICITNKHKIYLHVNITGMGETILEPNIPSVKKTFNQIRLLINKGFPQKQILVIVNPVLSNDNGLKALELLLRVFTEYKTLRLRFVRLNLLIYKYADDIAPPAYLKYPPKEKLMVANYNILKRPSTKKIMHYLTKTNTFIKDYYKLLTKYEAIISVDKGEEPLIGVRELLPFGYNNSWIESDGTKTKLIEYENNNKYKPITNIISNKNPIRCLNKCLLCPWKY